MKHMDYDEWDARCNALDMLYERAIEGKTCIGDCLFKEEYDRASDGKAFLVCERNDLILHDDDSPRSIGCEFFEEVTR